jgi:hypothetical protein
MRISPSAARLARRHTRVSNAAVRHLNGDPILNGTVDDILGDRAMVRWDNNTARIMHTADLRPAI